MTNIRYGCSRELQSLCLPPRQPAIAFQYCQFAAPAPLRLTLFLLSYVTCHLSSCLSFVTHLTHAKSVAFQYFCQSVHLLAHPSFVICLSLIHSIRTMTCHIPSFMSLAARVVCSSHHLPSVANAIAFQCIREGFRKTNWEKVWSFFWKEIDPHFFFKNKTLIEWEKKNYTWSYLKIYSSISRILFYCSLILAFFPPGFGAFRLLSKLS